MRQLLLGLALAAWASAVPGAWYETVPEPPTILTLPLALEAAANDWELSRQLKVVDDELLGQPVFEQVETAHGWIRTRQAVSGPCEITAVVRLTNPTKIQGVTLHYGAVGDVNPDSVYAVAAYVGPQWGLRGLRVTPTLGAFANRYLGLTTRSEAAVKQRFPGSIYFRERFSEISPVSDPAFRQEVEAATAPMPLIAETWFTLRIVHTAEALQIYRDGWLIAERLPPGPVAGQVFLKLSGSVRVAQLRITQPAPASSEFYPVSLDGNCNAALADVGVGLVDLPPPGGLVRVADKPFRFSRDRAGRDHLDVSASLFHYRNQTGHFMANKTWPKPALFDATRLRLSVPNRPYERLWLVAAADDNPLHVPLVTVRFYRPDAGFPIDAEAAVPSLTATTDTTAKRLPITFADGKAGSLWLLSVPLDAVRIASEFREAETLSVELTKQVFPYRTYPDPANYSWFQGGLPSGVRILGLTFEAAPVAFRASGDRTGNVYVMPEQPVWQVALENLREQPLTGEVRLEVSDPFGGKRDYIRSVNLPAGEAQQVAVPLQPEVYGLHEVRCELRFADRRYEDVGTFVQLPLDRRHARPGRSYWGLWNWGGTHGTNPNHEETLYLNRAAGSTVARGADAAMRRAWGVMPAPAHVVSGPEPWAKEDPYDPEKYAEFKDRIGKQTAEMYAKNPDTPSFSVFTETAITPEITYGVPPQYLGEGERVYSEEEQTRLRAFMVTLKAACEGIREHAPRAKIALGWCEPFFAAPILKAGFPREMFDYIGVDSPQFERLPEMPIREIAPNRMWLLAEAMKAYGYEDVPIIHTESYYPSSHPLGLGFARAADHVVRTAVLSLALGSDILANCFTMHDCSNYWGSQHYGCIGLIGRRPAYNPKPAFAAFATMTQMVDTAKPDGYVPTSSHSVYCVRFRAGTTAIHCLWVLRGTRPVTLRFAQPAAAVTSIDANGNERQLEPQDGAVELQLSATPQWLRVEAPQVLEQVDPGAAVFTAAPGANAKVLDTLASPWAYRPGDYEDYAKNHWAMPRYAGPMRSEAVASEERRRPVWEVALTTPEVERPLAAWYGVFEPPQPVLLPGKPKALGVWANGHSNWGRIVYELADANGEIWLSVGAKDDWNCDDTHAWSYFIFDGWRYLEFPLPSHQPGDNYRGCDTVWWKYSDDGIVDLPLRLTKVIIEQRTHNIYVNELVPEPDPSVQLSDLTVVYEDVAEMTSAPVETQQAARGLITFDGAAGALPNPIADLLRDGVGEPPVITNLRPPEHGYDGTRVLVSLAPSADAKSYKIYVSAYADGAGAQEMAKGEGPEILVQRLRAEFPLFLFVTSVDDAKKESQPSAATRILLQDDFPMK